MANTKNPDNEKAKYWLAISYPGDSEPENWQELAKATGLECCSSLHDKDINEAETTANENGDIVSQTKFKKLHRHHIVAFPNSTTKKNAQKIISGFTNGLEVKACSNIRGAYAYLTHRFDPDKAQYDEKDIICLNGFAPENYFTMHTGEENEAFKCIEKIIKEQDFEEYCDVVDYLEANYPELARFARTHTLHLKAYTQSKNFKKRQAKKDRLLDLQIAEYERRARLSDLDYMEAPECDPLTGEILD